MTFNLLIFIGSFFFFILSMIGTLGSFFDRIWKWFCFMLACALLSGACMFLELDLLLIPQTEREAAVSGPQPQSPVYP
jgi:hypothetical protein